MLDNDHKAELREEIQINCPFRLNSNSILNLSRLALSPSEENIEKAEIAICRYNNV
jgi:hypothetical protein